MPPGCSDHRRRFLKNAAVAAASFAVAPRGFVDVADPAKPGKHTVREQQVRHTQAL